MGHHTSRVRKKAYSIKIVFPHPATSWLLSSSSPPLAGEITEGEQAAKGFFSSLLENCRLAFGAGARHGKIVAQRGEANRGEADRLDG